MTLGSPHGPALTNANQKRATDKLFFERTELFDDRRQATDHSGMSARSILFADFRASSQIEYCPQKNAASISLDLTDSGKIQGQNFGLTVVHDAQRPSRMKPEIRPEVRDALCGQAQSL